MISFLFSTFLFIVIFFRILCVALDFKALFICQQHTNHNYHDIIFCCLFLFCCCHGSWQPFVSCVPLKYAQIYFLNNVIPISVAGSMDIIFFSFNDAQHQFSADCCSICAIAITCAAQIKHTIINVGLLIWIKFYDCSSFARVSFILSDNCFSFFFFFFRTFQRIQYQDSSCSLDELVRFCF
jgi:hypothetical protein